MKKVLLTLALGFGLLTANAQWIAVTTINKVTTIAGEDIQPGEVYDLDVCPGTKRYHFNITDRLGVGYKIQDKVIVGITRSGKDINDEYNYDVFARYNIKNTALADIWAVCEYNYFHSSDEKYTDYIDLGLMYSMEVWNSFYLEPNYTKSMKDGEEGQFNIALSYIF
jgi:hypothetical protein|tara:strand:+ start:35 stop:535 length:501 start_codon:yes stop_codon:yes gene_type:complete